MIWIRSQNRDRLVYCSAVWIYENQILGEDGVSNDENYFELGDYKSEEDVLKVLDSIQVYIQLGGKVFQMPEDEEV